MSRTSSTIVGLSRRQKMLASCIKLLLTAVVFILDVPSIGMYVMACLGLPLVGHVSLFFPWLGERNWLLRAFFGGRVFRGMSWLACESRFPINYMEDS